MKWKDQVILITGVSSGLGRALIKEASRRGAVVVGTSRKGATCQELTSEFNKSGKKGYFYTFEISHINEIPTLIKKIEDETKSSISILINNVGPQVMGLVYNTPLSFYTKSFSTNVLAPIAFIQATIPGMAKKKFGYICNVMSSIMFHAFPGVSAYAASKKALGAIHEGLSLELMDSGIKTLDIRPGGMKTRYWENTDIGQRLGKYKKPERSEYARDPQIVAKIILDAIALGKEKVDLSTWKDRVVFHLNYWCPSLLKKLLIKKNAKMIREANL